MFFWYPSMMLAFEASSVISARLTKIALGGSDVGNECQLMIMEKIGACLEAGSIVANGGNAGDIIANYRKHVAANAARLG